MTQKPRNPRNYASDRHYERAASMGIVSDSLVGAALNDLVGVPISGAACISSGRAAQEIGIPVHISTREDIEKELAKIEERFGMSPEEFYNAWKNDEFHGFQAMKFGCLYEFYRDEFE